MVAISLLSDKETILTNVTMDLARKTLTALSELDELNAEVVADAFSGPWALVDVEIPVSAQAEDYSEKFVHPDNLECWTIVFDFSHAESPRIAYAPDDYGSPTYVAYISGLIDYSTVLDMPFAFELADMLGVRSQDLISTPVYPMSQAGLSQLTHDL